MNNSPAPDLTASAFITALSSAQTRGELYKFENALRGALETAPSVISDARALLKSSSNKNPMLLEALDKLLSAATANDKETTQRGGSRWTTLALTGVLRYAGQDVLNRVSDASSLRKHIATTLGLPANEVVVDGLVMSSEGAYGLLPSEAVALSKFWRAVSAIPAYRALAESISNHRILPFTGETRIQVVHLVHVLLGQGDDVETAVNELDASFEGDASFDFRFLHGCGAETTASFAVWGCRMPWEAFQDELYLYESTHIVNMCVHAARQKQIALNRLQVHLAILAASDDSYSLQVSIGLTDSTPICAFQFEHLAEPYILRTRAADMLERLGIPACTAQEVQYQDLSGSLG